MTDTILETKRLIIKELKQELEVITEREKGSESQSPETVLETFENWLSCQIQNQKAEIEAFENIKKKNLKNDKLNRTISLVKHVHHALKNMPDTTTSRGGKLTTGQLKARANKIIKEWN